LVAEGVEVTSPVRVRVWVREEVAVVETVALKDVENEKVILTVSDRVLVEVNMIGYRRLGQKWVEIGERSRGVKRKGRHGREAVVERRGLGFGS
jgi:hypothetical protein